QGIINSNAEASTNQKLQQLANNSSQSRTLSVFQMIANGKELTPHVRPDQTRPSDNNSPTPVVQMKDREKGDLDYGFAGRRQVAMEDAESKGQDKRGNVAPTVDELNGIVKITNYMDQFMFFEMLEYIRGFSQTVDDAKSHREKHAVAWLLFLQNNIERINLKKQVDVAIGETPDEASKDRLNKNKKKGSDPPQKETLRKWYYDRIKPVDETELDLLEYWVWNAFFRRTSKLGIEFTKSIGKAIHFNITNNAYGRALAGRGDKASHGKQAITHSELRHLKRLQDRGEAPEVHFQKNEADGVKDVESPFGSLDMLSSEGIARLLQTPEWKKEAVDYETQLGVYASKRPEAKEAVQNGLNKMDLVLGAHNNSKTAEEGIQHRAVFGQQKSTSAGQIGDDPRQVYGVITGTPMDDHADPINHREQMTAYYNAAFWNASKGTTISKLLKEIGKIEDAGERQRAVEKVGLTKENIDKIHLKIKTQKLNPSNEEIEAGKTTIRELYAKESGKQKQESIDSLKITSEEADALVKELVSLQKVASAYASASGGEKSVLQTQFDEKVAELARTYTRGKVNLLKSDIDTDESRSARVKRGAENWKDHQKTSKDYTDMGAPLSSREKAAITPKDSVFSEAAKLPWVEGITYYSIDESTGWGKAMKEAGIPTVAGNSGSTSRLLQIYNALGLGNPLNFRLALMGWMLPSRDHSLYEIMQGAKAAGVAGAGESLDSPIDMYQKVLPLSKSDLKTNVANDNLFPHEKVLRTVDKPTYKQLIKQ
ncbi:MAG: hypothetical protein AAFN93_20380, partial [Bacteroidota bacterium]